MPKNVLWLLWMLLGMSAVHAQEEPTAPEMYFSTVARGSVLFDLPRMIGPSGDIMLGTVDSSSLTCGSIIQVVDWSFKYTTVYESVPPEGCTDIASYTMTDGSYQTTAKITISIAANQPPYAGGVSEVISVNRVFIINVTAISSDSDGDVVTLVKVGKTRYGTATADGNIITYRPSRDKVSAQLGAKEAFSFSVTDGRGGSGQGIIEFTIQENRPPYVGWYNEFKVDRNNSVTIDLQVDNVTDTSYPILDPDADTNITAVVDFSSAKLGTVKRLRNGLYEYTALPGVSEADVRETFTVTVSDDRGGSATGEFTVVILYNYAPVAEQVQAVSTLSNRPVVVAPLIGVSDYNGDDARLVVLNISRPKFGKLEFLSCCNSVKGENAYWYYKNGKQVADYRYTPDPSLIKSSDVVENITYTVSDLKGGFATAVISITIKPGPNCSADLYGVQVPGFIASADTYSSGVIPECGGVFSWTNCFNGRRSESRNAACLQGNYFNIEDVYGWDSPYNGSMALICLLPSRKLPCRPKSNTAVKGVTMWQSLGTEPCSAECDLVTKEFTAPASAFVSPAYDCDSCIDCNPDKCPNTPNGPAIGPEVCCVGAPATTGGGGGNTTNSTSPPPPRCSECTGQPAAPVCGADSNTYVSACIAACQGVNVSAAGPCEGTPLMLDLSQSPDLTSPEAVALMRDGFQVLGVAKTTDAPMGDDGFPVPDDTGDVTATAALKWRTPKPSHFQVFKLSRIAFSTDALLGALKPAALSKVYNAYKKIAKTSQVVLPNVKGPRVGWSKFKEPELTYPFKAIGLLARTARGGGTNGFCTAWLVRPNLVVTAAHCVFNVTTGLAVWPGHLRFLPQVFGGKANAKLKGTQGYQVVALSLPGWYTSLADSGDGPRAPLDKRLWDMALLYLSESVPCDQCLLRPAIVVGRMDYGDRLQLAGYGVPSNSLLQLNMSLPFDAVLRPSRAYSYTKAATTSGHSGAPYWPASVAYEKDPDQSQAGVPQGVLPYAWPAFGVHSGATARSANAVMMQFTHAHLKWIFQAGGNKVIYLACSGSEATRDTNCVQYKFAGQ